MTFHISHVDEVVEPIDVFDAPGEEDSTERLRAQKSGLEDDIGEVERLIDELKWFVSAAWDRISEIDDALDEREAAENESEAVQAAEGSESEAVQPEAVQGAGA
jgi:hypothetical protein